MTKTNNESQNREQKFVTLYNKTRNQPVYIQLRAPKGVDFYIGEQTVILHCGKIGKFPVNRLYKEQIINHAKAGRISILSGSLEE
ncbi:MAG: hypothetical protein QXU32_00615 [Nitrososphaerales archaeon]